ncbi:MAG: T9SS type A sorting domain-containing protein [Crocinitomicaceae bacterium]
MKGIENTQKIEVFSTLGESVYIAEINGNITTVDLGEMKGLYLVRLYGSNGVATTRRVILK